MYKVLAVREYNLIENQNNYLNVTTGGLRIDNTHYITVICENEETHKRERFDFYKGYERKSFNGKIDYYGYSGNYNLLIVGDRFEIKETKKFPVVVIKK